MKTTRLRLSVLVESNVRPTVVLEGVSPDLFVSALIGQLLKRVKIRSNPDTWRLVFNGEVLSSDSKLSSCLPLADQLIELTLIEAKGVDSVTDTTQLSSDLQDAPVDDLTLDFCLEDKDCNEKVVSNAVIPLEDSDCDWQASGCAMEAYVASPQKPIVRRATVRYYRRMNPDRAYPLLVLITKDLIDRIKKKDTDQITSEAFTVKPDLPVEIEPILPGCDCYPRKLVVRLSEGEVTAKFRIIPRVFGKIEECSVAIRQDHQLLSDVPLDVKIVNRLWVLMSGLFTFGLPASSSILKYFGVGFDAQENQPVDIYVTVARLVFDQVSPLVLTIGLGLCTVLIWWYTRPVTRDVFWDVQKLGPAGRLSQIITALKARDASAERDLMALLTEFPVYQPARFCLADWKFINQEYRGALQEYLRAFELGVGKPSDYLCASFAASKIANNEVALKILQDAEKKLVPSSITPTMLYNLGCYLVRTGDLDQAMEYLRRALAAGFAKKQLYFEDADLVPLRKRSDFQKLLMEIQGVH